ncbi:MAG: hypothetical protein AB7L66_02175, partial [Gemmatimonadales bacterium]
MSSPAPETRPDGEALEAQVTLAVFEASSAFTAIWDQLAADTGAAVERFSNREVWAASPHSVRIAAVGGAEA